MYKGRNVSDLKVEDGLGWMKISVRTDSMNTFGANNDVLDGSSTVVP